MEIITFLRGIKSLKDFQSICELPTFSSNNAYFNESTSLLLQKIFCFDFKDSLLSKKIPLRSIMLLKKILAIVEDLEIEQFFMEMLCLFKYIFRQADKFVLLPNGHTLLWGVLEEVIPIISETVSRSPSLRQAVVDHFQDRFLSMILTQLPLFSVTNISFLVNHFNACLQSLPCPPEIEPYQRSKLGALICSCGDYALQLRLLELHTFLGLKPTLPPGRTYSHLQANITKENFDEDCRSFLNEINGSELRVVSFQCSELVMGTMVMEGPLWVDWNHGSYTVSWTCDGGALGLSSGYLEPLTLRLEEVRDIKYHEQQLFLCGAPVSAGSPEACALLETMTHRVVLTFLEKRGPRLSQILRLLRERMPPQMKLNLLMKDLHIHKSDAKYHPRVSAIEESMETDLSVENLLRDLDVIPGTPPALNFLQRKVQRNVPVVLMKKCEEKENEECLIGKKLSKTKKMLIVNSKSQRLFVKAPISVKSSSLLKQTILDTKNNVEESITAKKINSNKLSSAPKLHANVDNYCEKNSSSSTCQSSASKHAYEQPNNSTATRRKKIKLHLKAKNKTLKIEFEPEDVQISPIDKDRAALELCKIRSRTDRDTSPSPTPKLQEVSLATEANITKRRKLYSAKNDDPDLSMNQCPSEEETPLSPGGGKTKQPALSATSFSYRRRMEQPTPREIRTSETFDNLKAEPESLHDQYRFPDFDSDTSVKNNMFPKIKSTSASKEQEKPTVPMKGKQKLSKLINKRKGNMVENNTSLIDERVRCNPANVAKGDAPRHDISVDLIQFDSEDDVPLVKLSKMVHPDADHPAEIPKVKKKATKRLKSSKNICNNASSEFLVLPTLDTSLPNLIVENLPILKLNDSLEGANIMEKIISNWPTMDVSSSTIQEFDEEVELAQSSMVAAIDLNLVDEPKMDASANFVLKDSPECDVQLSENEMSALRKQMRECTVNMMLNNMCKIIEPPLMHSRLSPNTCEIDSALHSEDTILTIEEEPILHEIEKEPQKLYKKFDFDYRKYVKEVSRDSSPNLVDCGSEGDWSKDKPEAFEKSQAVFKGTNSEESQISIEYNGTSTKGPFVKLSRLPKATKKYKAVSSKSKIVSFPYPRGKNPASSNSNMVENNTSTMVHPDADHPAEIPKVKKKATKRLKSSKNICDNASSEFLVLPTLDTSLPNLIVENLPILKLNDSLERANIMEKIISNWPTMDVSSSTIQEFDEEVELAQSSMVAAIDLNLVDEPKMDASANFVLKDSPECDVQLSENEMSALRKQMRECTVNMMLNNMCKIIEPPLMHSRLSPNTCEIDSALHSEDTILTIEEETILHEIEKEPQKLYKKFDFDYRKYVKEVSRASLPNLVDCGSEGDWSKDKPEAFEKSQAVFKGTNSEESQISIEYNGTSTKGPFVKLSRLPKATKKYKAVSSKSKIVSFPYPRGKNPASSNRTTERETVQVREEWNAHLKELKLYLLKCNEKFDQLEEFGKFYFNLG